jgi:hypothetical protein
MRHLSLWGRAHKNAARLIIVASFILLTLLGLFCGSMLSGLGFTLGTSSLVTCMVFYFAGILVYPFSFHRGSKFSKKSFFKRQKACDLLLAACTFFMLVYFGNHPGKFNLVGSLHAATPSSSIPLSDSSVKKYKTISAFAASLKDETGKSLKWKEKRKLLKDQLKAIKKGPELTSAQKTILTILSIIVAIGLLYLVAALSCSLSCGGSEAAAFIVGIGGLALVVLLLVVVLRAIHRKTKKEKMAREETENSM